MSLDIFVQLDVVGEGQNTTAVWRDHRNTVRTANDVVDQLVVIILTSILNRGPPRGRHVSRTDERARCPVQDSTSGAASRDANCIVGHGGLSAVGVVVGRLGLEERK